MGLFSYNYSKPGPGIDKNAPQKKGIFRYFEIFFRKFWKLIQVNLLYSICSIPLLLIVYAIAPVSDSFLSGLISAAELESSAEEIIMNMQLVLRSFFAVIILVLWGSGPASASYAYITRCFTREQHAWIFSDFKDKFIENFKQSIVVVIVDIVVLFLAIYGIYFYFVTYKSTGSQIWLLACCLMCTMLIVYTFMHFYIYQFMVTFSSKLTQLYKNALIFSLAQLPFSILLAALAIVINFIMFSYLHPMFVVFIDFILGISIMRFPIEYCAARAIEKKLLPHATVIEQEDDSIFSENESEIGYENGSETESRNNEGEE